MAKQASAVVEKTGIFTRLQDFLQEVMVEMKKVTWPTKQEISNSTQVVLFLLVVVAAIIFVYDNVFQFLVVNLLKYLG